MTQMAYGDEGSPLTPSTVPDLLDRVMPKEDNDRLARMSFWGNFADPEKNPNGGLSTALGAGMKAQATTEAAQQALRAQYVPLIMQSLIQQQNMTLNAAHNTRSWMNEVQPKFTSHMAALRTNDQQPDYAQTVNHALNFGANYQLPPGVMRNMIGSIPQEPDALKQWLDQNVIESAGAKELVPTVGKNAADQTTLVSPGKGTQTLPSTVGAPAAPGTPQGTGAAPGAASNPTSPDVNWVKEAQGDPKKYGESLATETQTMHDVTGRMTEMAKLMQDFQAGRYAKPAGGAAAIAKDLLSRLPGVDPKAANELANKIVGAQPGTANGLAAQQAMSQFGQQEILAQLRDALAGNRLNRNEYQAFQGVMQTASQDPEAFKIMQDYMNKRATDYANRYSAWSNYLSDPAVKNKSVAAFDSEYHQKSLKSMFEAKDNVPATGALKAPAPTADSNKPKAAPAAAAPGVAPPKAIPQEVLAKYPGAKMGPTGKIFVPDPKSPMGWRRVG